MTSSEFISKVRGLGISYSLSECEVTMSPIIIFTHVDDIIQFELNVQDW